MNKSLPIVVHMIIISALISCPLHALVMTDVISSCLVAPFYIGSHVRYASARLYTHATLGNMTRFGGSLAGGLIGTHAATQVSDGITQEVVGDAAQSHNRKKLPHLQQRAIQVRQGIARLSGGIIGALIVGEGMPASARGISRTLGT